jgi:hypothetical protein
MKRTSRIIQRKIDRLREIVAHISPYQSGLAPETRDFVAALNAEAARLRTGVKYIALANRIEARGSIERAAKRTDTLGGWFLSRAIAVGYLDGVEIVLRRGNSYQRKKLRKRNKTRAGRVMAAEAAGIMAERRRIWRIVETSEAFLGRSGHIPGHWPREWIHGVYMPRPQPWYARMRPKATLSQKDSGGNPEHLIGYLSRNAQDRPGILEMMVPKKGRGHF